MAVLQKLLGLTFLLGGALLLVALLFEWMRQRAAREAIVFVGRVVALRSSRTFGDLSAHYHQATVAYSVDGIDYLSVLRILPGEVLPLPGSGIRLSCLPWKPEQLRPAPTPLPKGRIGRLALCCIVLLLFGTALCLPW